MSVIKNQGVETQVDEAKVPHTGGADVPSAEVPNPEKGDAEDPKADGKKKKKAEEAGKSATKVKEEVESEEEVISETPTTKSGMINTVLDEMKTKSKSELEALFSNIIDTINEEKDEDDDEDIDDELEDEAEEKSEKKKAKKVTAEELNIEEDVKALFGDEELSEDFKDKATTIFKATVVSKINESLTEITEENDTELTEGLEKNFKEMSSKVDDYLEYVVENWVKDNELAIEAGIRNELTEDFIGGLKSLFEEHYIDVPEDKVDVLEEMGNRIEDLESQLDESISATIVLQKDIAEHNKDDILEEIASGLVDTDAEKLRSLSEGVEFESTEDYKNKLSVLKENYFPGTVKTVLTEELDETPVDDGSEPIQGPMSGYVNAISRTTGK